MQEYCVRMCMAILHGMSGERAQAHSHTIELAAYIQKDNNVFELFTNLERRIEKYINRYNNQFLNILPEFANDASIENIGEVFFAGLTDVLRQDGFTLTRLEVGETPLRQYIIGLAD